MIAVVVTALLFTGPNPLLAWVAYAEQGDSTEESALIVYPTPEETAAPTPTVGAETSAPTVGATPPVNGESTLEPTTEPTPAPTLEPAPGNVLCLAPEVFGGSYQKLKKLNYLPGGMEIPVLYQYHYTKLVATRGEEKISVPTSMSLR